MKAAKLAFLLFLISIIPAHIKGQTNTQVPVDFGVWAAYNGNQPFNDGSPWQLRSKAQARGNRGILEAQGYLFEAGVGYKFNREWQAAVGYAFKYNVPYDSASQPYQWPQQRIWEEVAYADSYGNDEKALKHRLRLEERWLGRKSAPNYDEITHYQYQTRLRYRIRLERPVRSNKYLIVEDEVFLRLTPTDEKLFNQNRLFGGLAFDLDKERRYRLEIGYMLQTVRNSNETQPGWQRVNNVVRIEFSSEAPLGLR